jgi:ABC-type glycerol-3-phosphate transport system substrate-binding protein
MKRIIILFAIALLMASVLSAQNVSGRLTVWSFTDEVENMVNNYFLPSHRGVQIDYTMFQTEDFQNNLDPVLFSGQGAPDVMVLESDFVKKYIESGLLLDITDIYEANKSKLIAYPVEIATYHGRVYGLSWQVCPGAFFYRRSLAKKYLGTDDPAAVQRYFSNLDQFLQTAKLLKEKSGGKCVVISSGEELNRLFLSMRAQPWVVGSKLVIDPAMEICMDYIKNLNGNGLFGGAGQWSDEWFAGMRGELKDRMGMPMEVFGCFLPTWGLHYVLKTNAPNTSGDWAMIQGPLSYSWGGSWIAASKNTKNPNAAKELIRYLTTDNGFLERWANDTGDVVSNIQVINKIKNSYREPFLGGQNHYAAFADMAQNVNGDLAQGTDNLIYSLFSEALWAYVNGEKIKAQALNDFRSQAAAALRSENLKKLSLILN